MSVPHLTDHELEELFRVHNGPVGQAGRASNATFFDDTRSWVDPNGYRLSDRLWSSRYRTRESIDRIILEAIASGADAISTAKRLELFLNPRYAPIRNSKGRLLRDLRRGVLTRTPRDGAGSYPARRLMRTEITRAHGQATKAVADKFENGIRWRLSGSHPHPDQCDENANGNSAGLPPNTPPGVYFPNDVPAYPDHPQDLCHLQHYLLKTIRDIVSAIRIKHGLGPLPDQ